MKLFKVVLILLALALVGVGAVALFGVVAALLKWLVIFGVIALAGVGAYKLLSKPDKGSPLELSSAEMEMMKTERMLAELKRSRLTK
jgi:hypothetical protein